MDSNIVSMSTQLFSAWLAGSLIGLERTYHGRPAGFRTHALVSLASAALMIVTDFQDVWLKVPKEMIRIDPARMAQGIMTGIGFLGAGVILKKGFDIRGLTTAASIWMTATLGILFGIGFYYPAILATVATLGTLSVFRLVEAYLPSQTYVHHVLRFPRAQAPKEEDIRSFIKQFGFKVGRVTYELTDKGETVQYSMIIRTGNAKNVRVLAENMDRLQNVAEYRLAPAEC